MSETDLKNPFENAPIIFQYSRAQAIEDGVLIDLTEWAKELGFKVPVACTAAVWNGYIVPTERTRALGSPSAAGHTMCSGCFPMPFAKAAAVTLCRSR